MMRVAVVGSGAMGGLFGARLAIAGAEVAMIDVSDAAIDAIRAEGLRLEDDDGHHVVYPDAGRADEIFGVCDVVLIFTKGPHTDAAAGAIRHLVGQESWIVTVQNGLGNEELIAARITTGRLAFGMTNWPADLASPGHVRSHGSGEMRIWQRGGGDAAALAPVADLFTRAGLNCVLDPHVEIPIWEKVIFNAAMNSIAAVTGLKVGQMADSAEARALIDAVIAEGMAVAEAAGVAIDRVRVTSAIAHALAEHRAHKPSMLQDIEAGRLTEVGSILEPIIARGALYGIGCDTIRTMTRLVRIAEERERVPHSSS